MTVERRADETLSTDRLVAETGVQRETLYEWVAWRVLPDAHARGDLRVGAAALVADRPTGLS